MFGAICDKCEARMMLVGITSHICWQVASKEGEQLQLPFGTERWIPTPVEMEALARQKAGKKQ